MKPNRFTSILFAAFAVPLYIVPASAAMSDADCQASWTAADLNKDGILDATEGARYSAALRVAGRPAVAADGFTSAVFLENCKAGYFETAAIEAGAPFEGANSFTEGQAQDRAIASGLTDVSALAKDDKGIWRGTAMLAGKQVSVAIDFKGNVVTSNQ